MLTYSFEMSGGESLYMQLYNKIKKDILAGTLMPGTKLPSKRSFAKNLGVSNITVENAYGQLQSEGYIYSLPKKGFYVTELSRLPVRQKKPKPHSFAQETAGPAYFADFVSNQTGADNFPFSVWAKLMREVMQQQQEELLAIPPMGGVTALREAICVYLRQFRNMAVQPKQVIVGAGTQYLYHLLLQLLGREKIYAVEDPGYQTIAKIYRQNGRACRFVPLDREGIDMAQLERSGADIAHVSPSHHYPTGIVTPISRRYELLGWASRQEGRYIIEDDYDSEFRLTGRPIPTLQSIDQMERVIYINTFSKSLASTVRIAYMVLPPHLLAEYQQKLAFYSGTVSNFEQYTLAKFIAEGYFEKHINRMRNHYRKSRDLLLAAISKSPLARISTIAEEEAGLHFLLKVQTGLTDRGLTERARRMGIHLSCLSEYYHVPGPDVARSVVIMNYSGIRQPDIDEAVRRLGDSFCE